MAVDGMDTLAGLEKLRLSLEENVAKLRKSLQHWQLWEAEYEGLKEEIGGLSDATSQQDLIDVGKTFGGDLLSEKEIRELAGLQDGSNRTPRQICDRLSRRIEYVQQNARTMQNQLENAERKLENVLFVRKNSVVNEEGLPLTEIREELDEDGNVIASSLSRPGDGTSQALEVLKKAGIAEQGLHQFEAAANAEEHATEVPGSSNIGPSGERADVVPEDGAARETSDHLIAPSSQNGKFTETRKKVVSFTEDTKPEAVESTPLSKQTAQMQVRKTSTLAELAKGSFKPGDRVIELNDVEEVVGAVQVPGESPEDAAMRQEMQQYSMSEVGSIVAQLDLEDAGSEEDEDFDDNDSEAPSSNGEENEYGMSTKHLIDDNYRKQMLELERKLNAQMLRNVGPQGGVAFETAAMEGLNPPETQEYSQGGQTQGVRFAEHTDEPQSAVTAPVEPSKGPNTPLSDAVFERNASQKENISSAPPTRKVSHFKSSRNSTTPLETPPVIPHASAPTLAAQVVERDASSLRPQPPDYNDSDDEDPALLRQKLATEYYAQRNRLINAQGGFVHRGEEMRLEEAEVLVGDEEESGGATKKKVSLFKAARLRGPTA